MILNISHEFKPRNGGGKKMDTSEIPNIISTIRRDYPVPETSILRLASYFKKHDFSPGHLLTSPGITDRHVYFIESGCTRTYFIAKEKEVTNWFSSEGDLTFSSTSFYHKLPAYEFVEVLEDTLIYKISIRNIEQLFSADIHLANWSRVLHQEALLKMQTLRLDRLSLSANERYEKFCRENPALLNRVNLGYIASYLGITQQYLSNLRSAHRF